MRFVKFYVIWAVVATFLTRGENLKYFGRPLWVIVSLYLGGGLLVALFVTVARPWAITRLRAYVAGVVVGIPVAVAIYMIFRPDWPVRLMAMSTVVWSLIVSGPYAVIIWSPPEESPRRPRTSRDCDICGESSGRHISGCPKEVL